jgi:hypothetical protein
MHFIGLATNVKKQQKLSGKITSFAISQNLRYVFHTQTFISLNSIYFATSKLRCVLIQGYERYEGCDEWND